MNNTLLLDDGRTLAYNEYGTKKGFPVIGLHGTPGSRVWFKNNDPISKTLGIRLITVDRPGYGLSSPKPNRTINDFNEDINALIDHLNIVNHSIFGVSGGGAYALAYAAAQYPNLYKTGIVASIFEFKNGKIPKDMCKPNRIGFFLARYLPWLLSYTYKQQRKLMYRNPEIYIKSAQKNSGFLAPSDQELLQNKDIVEANLEQFKEAFRVNTNEVSRELKLLASPWHINLKNILSEVDVWHGEEDTLSPISGLKNFVANIPRINTNYIKGKGHFLDEDNFLWNNILKSLMP